jgi:hypothetical protein
VLERFRRLSTGRKLVFVLGVLLVPPLAAAPVVLVAGSFLENGQRFGIVVTSWTVLLLAAALAWKTAK